MGTNEVFVRTPQLEKRADMQSISKDEADRLLGHSELPEKSVEDEALTGEQVVTDPVETESKESTGEQTSETVEGSAAIETEADTEKVEVSEKVAPAKPVQKMNKDELKRHALKHHEVDIDKSKGIKKLRDQVEALDIAKAAGESRE